MKLSKLVDPAHTAVVISEMQRGIAGDLVGPFMKPQAQEIEARGVTTNLRRLIDATRTNNVRVVHATLQFRRDRAGIKINTPMMAVSLKDPNYLLIGSDEAAVMPELDPREEDIIAARIHGMSAFNGTELDPILRSLDIKTIIIGGLSLNEAIIGMAIEAVNIGYSIVIAKDGSAGFPLSFQEDLYKYAFSLLGAVAPVDDIIAAWKE